MRLEVANFIYQIKITKQPTNTQVIRMCCLKWSQFIHSMWYDKIRLLLPLNFAIYRIWMVFVFVLFRFISLFCTFVWWFHDYVCLFLCSIPYCSIVLSLHLTFKLKEKRTNHFRFETVFDQDYFKSHWNYTTLLQPTLMWNAIQFEKENRNLLYLSVLYVNVLFLN